ncbi:ABC transporter permease [Blastopirellula retiformator]|uniref:Dipeptide transport system permease protein DppB n=1 Tax=Blastopirellula retiformator TaxID=2527970 RepID=A0A5C5V295_9BACT|nr:ABC transporter permease [Blastopirellula retiformator]TWT32093.1 Dipeptide transport system permease protein DppB [Blastopirellula retiformator]
MLIYIVRRLFISVITLVLITGCIYGLIRAMPGSPLTALLAGGGEASDKSISTQQYERMKEQFGLNKHWTLGYFDWLGGVLKGDLQNALSRPGSVAKLIGDRIAATLLLSVTSLILAYLLSIPLGLYSTARNGTIPERGTNLVLYMLYSLPVFVAALYLQILFHVKLEWLPLYGVTSSNYAELSLWGKAWDLFLHCVLPVTCFTYTSLAYYTRFIKANMLEVVQQDYIRTAKAKGVGPFKILTVHAFRNSLIPFVTLIGLTLPALFSGAIIIEKIFSWPGMGALFLDAISQRDYPLVMGLVLLFSSLTLLGQLLADILYGVVDPRISYS